ncbi:hypothetical protein PENTCL1PPCAC_20290, partial [Pristionchus entomophagus]
HSESMLSNAFRKNDTAVCRLSTANERDVRLEREEMGDKSVMCLMVSYLNSCIGKAKTSLQRKGITVSSVDSHGMPVDFSSRPIDPIFKVARAQLDNERHYIDVRHSRSPSFLSPKRPHSGHDSIESRNEKQVRIADEVVGGSPVQLVQ